MRTQEQINRVKQSEGNPFLMETQVTQQEIDNILAFYFNSNDVIEKNTGPKVLRLDEGNPILSPIIQRIKNEVGEFDVRYAHIFDVTAPHMIHNDDVNEYPDSYKAFTMPLKIYGNTDDISLVVFDQYYYGGPVKFVNGANTQGWTAYYNQYLTDYNDVEGINNQGINIDFRKKYLTHLEDSWIEGLSIKQALPWKIGGILCFDSLALHCSTDFRNVGVKRKIGLSIFTLRKQ
tara:strand:- start:12072 stop:12770 length:699 start_codon:yes stop_codon:yes gene_type:complete